MKADREILEGNLSKIIDEIKPKRAIVEEIKDGLAQYNVMPGDAQDIISENDLSKLDTKMLCLLTIETYKAVRSKLDNSSIINYETYFNKAEVKEYTLNIYELDTAKYKLPIELENVQMLGSSTEDYYTSMSLTQLVEMYNSKILRYNIETQRDPKFKGKLAVANINKKSVDEIAEHITNGTLVTSMITLNCIFGSNDGEEIDYDHKKQKLTINGGFVDILDGAHRLFGALKVYRQGNTEALDKMYMQVAVKNYKSPKARTFVAQINTTNSIDKTYLAKLKSERYADKIVEDLMRDSDLKGKVTPKTFLVPSAGHIVTYGTLADNIDLDFKINSKMEASEVAEYLTTFFDYLLGSYPESFKDDKDENEKNNLRNTNVMFNGYIALAAQMYEQNISAKRIKSVLDQINFDRSNPLWSEIGIIENGKLNTNPKTKKELRKYFKSLQLSELVG